ncbi:DUF5641 domain-containing protein [Trichonephila inaurata madagascariensis]|uniref:DUF5641 domain-containing protein n=1 Tax=Trichonephila inaurata madagascariensis TaxID=2747483 RepID=A0A8X6IJC2_9ARAC|nr:DUF5641 domain-containing protein [Trichonephila inaurata madagascariensis]
MTWSVAKSPRVAKGCDVNNQSINQLAQVIELFPGKDGVAKLRLASGEIIRPPQRIHPLELSASDHLIEDHQGAAQIPGPTVADVLEEGKKSRCGRPLIPVKRMNL